MSLLHTVNKSAFNAETLLNCLAICQAKHSVLLIEDGVYGAMKSSPCRNQIEQLSAQGVSFFALAPDVKARGLGDMLIAEVTLASDQDFVNLVVLHSATQSWY